MSNSAGAINCFDVVVIPGVEGDGGKALLNPFIVFAPFDGIAGIAKKFSLQLVFFLLVLLFKLRKLSLDFLPAERSKLVKPFPVVLFALDIPKVFHLDDFDLEVDVATEPAYSIVDVIVQSLRTPYKP